MYNSIIKKPKISYSNNYINKDQITKDKFNSIVFENVVFTFKKTEIAEI